MRKRLQKLVSRELLQQEELEKFLILETFMNSRSAGEDWLHAYHLSDDDYQPLLEKVLKGLCTIGEPFAHQKIRQFYEELGTQSPAGYFTPWELTLRDLDEEFSL